MNEIEEMKYEQRAKILELLLEIQKDAAPIELSIGWTKDEIVRKGIVIKSAAPVVAQKLMEAGYSLEIMPEGVRVYKII